MDPNLQLNGNKNEEQPIRDIEEHRNEENHIQENHVQIVQQGQANQVQQDLAQQNRVAHMQALQNEFPITVPESYIDTAGFATAFNTKLGSTKRFFRTDLRISRLFKKAENATLLRETMKEHKDKYKSLRKLAKKKLAGNPALAEDEEILAAFFSTGKTKEDIALIRRYKQDKNAALLSCADAFLSINMQDIKLNTDAEFAKSAKKILVIREKVSAIKKAMLNGIAGLSDEKKEEIKAQIERMERLSAYYDAREKLMCNNYYMTHYNSELSFLSRQTSSLNEAANHRRQGKKDERSKKEKEFEEDKTGQREVSNLIRGLEYANYFLKHGTKTKDEAEAEFKELIKNKYVEMNKLSMYDTYTRHSKKLTWGYCNGIGYFLQFLNWITGSKRKDTYGEAEYDESVAKLAYIPDELKGYVPGSDISLVKGNAPLVDIKDIVDDPLKNAVKEMLDHAPDPGADADYQAAREAIIHWTKVRGIVNLDTAKMEMAFLDRFIKSARRWLDANGDNARESQDAYLHEKYEFISRSFERITQYGKGGLGEKLPPEELQNIIANTQVISEDNTYLPNLNHSNVKDIPLFMHQPNINDIKQAFVGNCWLYSGVQAAVVKSPDVIRDMFYDVGDGSVIVRLYGITDETGEICNNYKAAYNNKAKYKIKPGYYRIRKDFEEGTGNGHDCLWVQMLEKAIALSGINGGFSLQVKDGKMKNLTSELTAGEPELGLIALTGERYTHYLYSKNEYKPKAHEPIMDYYYLLTGLPYSVKKAVADGMEKKKRAGKQWNKEVLGMFIQLEMGKYKTQVDMTLEVYELVKQDLQPYVGKPGFEGINGIMNLEENLKKIMFFEEASGDFEHKLELNISNVMKDLLPRQQKIDLKEFDDMPNKVKQGFNEIHALVTSNNNGDKDELIKTRVAEHITFITQRTERYNMSEVNLKKAVLDDETNMYAGAFKRNGAVRCAAHTSLRLQSDISHMDESVVNHLINLQNELRKHKAVPVYFGNHCMTVLDTKYAGGEWYVLVRDPFNLYFKQYTNKQDGTINRKSEGFTKLFNKGMYNKKRHLTNLGEESNMKYGFRGLSWWTFEDFYKGSFGFVQSP